MRVQYRSTVTRYASGSKDHPGVSHRYVATAVAVAAAPAPLWLGVKREPPLISLIYSTPPHGRTLARTHARTHRHAGEDLVGRCAGLQYLLLARALLLQPLEASPQVRLSPCAYVLP